jgi:hypothetical protein
MKSLIRPFMILLLLGLVGSAVRAQGLSLKDRSVLELNMGIWGGSRVSNTVGPSSIMSNANTSSFVGNILYAYGVREEVAVTLSIGMLTAGANSNVGMYGVQQQAAMVMQVLLGARYYVPNPEDGTKVRPFISLSIGPYIGMESSSSAGMTVIQESQTESAFGGRIGIGLDLFTGYHFKFVANASYDLMTDFSVPISARDNFDGGDFSLGVGYAF